MDSLRVDRQAADLPTQNDRTDTPLRRHIRDRQRPPHPRQNPTVRVETLFQDGAEASSDRSRADPRSHTVHSRALAHEDDSDRPSATALRGCSADIPPGGWLSCSSMSSWSISTCDRHARFLAPPWPFGCARILPDHSRITAARSFTWTVVRVGAADQACRPRGPHGGNREAETCERQDDNRDVKSHSSKAPFARSLSQERGQERVVERCAFSGTARIVGNERAHRGTDSQAAARRHERPCTSVHIDPQRNCTSNDRIAPHAPSPVIVGHAGARDGNGDAQIQ
jgi:hypothetical protein